MKVFAIRDEEEYGSKDLAYLNSVYGPSLLYRLWTSGSTIHSL